MVTGHSLETTTAEDVDALMAAAVAAADLLGAAVAQARTCDNAQSVDVCYACQALERREEDLLHTIRVCNDVLATQLSRGRHR
jgi:malonyl CoA-acyl carrier protein transacylase